MDNRFYREKEIFISRQPDTGIADTLYVKDILDDWDALNEQQREDQYRSSKVLFYSNIPAPENKNDRIALKWKKTQELNKMDEEDKEKYLSDKKAYAKKKLIKAAILNWSSALFWFAVFVYFTYDTLAYLNII